MSFWKILKHFTPSELRLLSSIILIMSFNSSSQGYSLKNFISLEIKHRTRAGFPSVYIALTINQLE